MSAERLSGRILVETNVLIYATIFEEGITIVFTENVKDFESVEGNSWR